MSMIRVLKDNLMSRILRNARNCHLYVKLDSETPGYGNCWYHSVMQQIRRPDISPHIDLSIRYLNEKELRNRVSHYIHEIQDYCPAIQRFKQRYVAINPNLSWDQYYRQQSTDGEYADELFIMATAVLIGVDIHINSATCTLVQPVNVIKNSWEDDGTSISAYDNSNASNPYLIIGYDSEHFQSLLPSVNVTINNDTFISYADVVKSNRDLRMKIPPRPMFKSNQGANVSLQANDGNHNLKRQKETYQQDEEAKRMKQKHDEKDINVPNKRKYDQDARKMRYQQKKDFIKIENQKNNEKINAKRRQNYDKDARKMRYQREKDILKMKREQKKQNEKQKNHEMSLDIQNISQNSEDIDFNVERPISQITISEADVAVKECINETINTVVSNIEIEFEKIYSRDIHSNPKVVKAILEFEKGEMLHEIGKCITCCEIQPVFNVRKCLTQLKNGQPAPVSNDTWKIFKDGRCKRCHEEYLKNSRECNCKPAKFSGNIQKIRTFHQIQIK